eukprot:s640_g13.t1
MSKEVAGQPEDTSLLDCIELGTEEVALWRRVMEFLHDMGEGEEEEEEEEDEEDLPPSQEAVAEDEGPELIPDAELREMFRPDQEPVVDYLTRIARIVLALRAHGVAISSGELDMLTTKASLLAEEFGQVGGD